MVSWHCLLLLLCSLVLPQEEDDLLYVDGDDVRSEGKTRVEIFETGRFSEIFEDDVVKHSSKEVNAHLSSSTEDIIDLLEKEQMLINKLVVFLKTLSIEDSKIQNFKKISKSISSLEKYLVIYNDEDDANQKRYVRLLLIVHS